MFDREMKRNKRWADAERKIIESVVQSSMKINQYMEVLDKQKEYEQPINAKKLGRMFE